MLHSLGSPFSLPLVAVGVLVGLTAGPTLASDYAWGPKSDETLVERFATPSGFHRVPVAKGSFGAWLRALPMAPKGTPVRAYDGRRLAADSAGVIDIDVGNKDLQQCADSILRLRSEYLFATGQHEAIRFHFTSGDVSAWSKWAQGFRPKVGKRSVRFAKTAKPDNGYRSFRAYLKNLFIYAGTASMERFSKKVAKAAADDVRPGMFFVRGGFPGHAVMVLDVIEDGRGHRKLLLGQGYMPAQSFHVVNGSEGPWFSLDDGAESIQIPTWPSPFSMSSLRQF